MLWIASNYCQFVCAFFVVVFHGAPGICQFKQNHLTALFSKVFWSVLCLYFTQNYTNSKQLSVVILNSKLFCWRNSFNACKTESQQTAEISKRGKCILVSVEQEQVQTYAMRLFFKILNGFNYYYYYLCSRLHRVTQRERTRQNLLQKIAPPICLLMSSHSSSTSSSFHFKRITIVKQYFTVFVTCSVCTHAHTHTCPHAYDAIELHAMQPKAF